jgi:prevent-host-death family protein
MVHIRPVSDLRNKFTDIEKNVQGGDPVFLTKNGYGTMVVLSLEAYCKLIDPVEYELDIADEAAESSDVRLTHDQVFDSLRRKVDA